MSQRKNVAEPVDLHATHWRNIVVIGTSAGGPEVLDDLVGQLPTDLEAAVFIVQHMAPEASGEILVDRLNKHD